MTRSVLYGLVLVSVAAAAVLWAVSPGCLGGLCLGSGAVPETPASAPAVQVTTEELGQLWQESEPARAAPESAPAGETETAVERTLEELGSAEPDLAVSDEESADLDQGVTADPVVAAEREAKAAEQWAELASAALSEPDPELRGEAVHGVGLHRNADSVAVLLEVAADDPDPDNRIQALEQLWYSAADGLDGDGAITRSLEAALGDPDEEIAALAEQALADLAKLEQAN